jgi:uncharacterized protein (TIGR02646 family)
MKKVNKDFDRPPAILVNAARQRKIRTALDTQSAHHISNSDYSPAAAKGALETLYHEKCSYCESTVKQVAALQVEHYRPKNGISEDAAHRGYYWLAVEWSNLVLGCPACNGQGAKGNKFPIAGQRVFAQNPFETGQFARENLYPDRHPLAGELPDLLHPELDDPKIHLKFTAFALLRGRTARGKKTILICGLNRDPLIVERQRIINNFLTQCNIVFAGKIEFTLPNEVVDALLLAQLRLLKSHRDNPKEPYTAFVEYLLNNPSICVYPRVEAMFKPDIKRAFAKFRRENRN